VTEHIHTSTDELFPMAHPKIIRKKSRFVPAGTRYLRVPGCRGAGRVTQIMHAVTAAHQHGVSVEHTVDGLLVKQCA
jgi:hypothetical protein